MKTFVHFAACFNDSVIVFVYRTVLITNNGRIIALSSSVLLAIVGSNIRAKSAAEPQTSSLRDSSFDSITDVIVSMLH